MPGIQNRKGTPPAGLDQLGLAIGVLAAVLWGLTGVFIRYLGDLPAPAIATGRLLIAIAGIAPFLLLKRRRWVALGFSPLPLAMGAYYLFATEGFVRAPIVEVALIVGFAPALALVIERVRGGRPTRRQITGAGIAITGLILFLTPSYTGASTRSMAVLWGDVLAMCAALSSAIYAIGLQARASSGREVDPLAMTLLACLYGSIGGLLLVWLNGEPVSVDVGDLAFLSALGLISTAAPTLAFGFAAGRLPAVATTSLSLLAPIFAGLFAGLVLGEWPEPAALPGALVAISGLWLVVRPKTEPGAKAPR